MNRIAQIEYLNAPEAPVDITLHVNTVAQLPCGGWRVHAVEKFPCIASKAAAMALARSLGAALA